MNKDELKGAIDRYNQRLKDYGETEQALGWGEKGRSRLRFHVLCSEFNLENTIVLDFGCGFGDLCGYIRDNFTTNFRYIGVDINPNLLEVAKKKYGSYGEFHLVDENAKDYFEKNDIRADYILSSGIFNFKLDDNPGFIKSTIELFNRFSDKGFAANFMSDKVDFEASSNYHSNPGEILELFYKFNNNLLLKNNYMAFEFTVFANKQIPVDKRLFVYQDYLNFV